MQDTYYDIFKYLSINDIYQCSMVCKDFNKVTNYETLWKEIYLKNFKDEKLFGSYYDTCKKYQNIIKFSNMIYFKTIKLKSLINMQYFYIEDINLGIIPTEIKYLQNFKGVTIKNCNITIIPTELFLLTNLTDLVIVNNSLEIIPTEIGLLTKLTKLFLKCNEYTIIPTEIKLLKNVEYLDL